MSLETLKAGWTGRETVAFVEIEAPVLPGSNLLPSVIEISGKLHKNSTDFSKESAPNGWKEYLQGLGYVVSYKEMLTER